MKKSITITIILVLIGLGFTLLNLMDISHDYLQYVENHDIKKILENYPTQHIEKPEQIYISIETILANQSEEIGLNYNLEEIFSSMQAGEITPEEYQEKIEKYHRKLAKDKDIQQTVLAAYLYLMRNHRYDLIKDPRTLCDGWLNTLSNSTYNIISHDNYNADDADELIVAGAFGQLKSNVSVVEDKCTGNIFRKYSGHQWFENLPKLQKFSDYNFEKYIKIGISESKQLLKEVNAETSKAKEIQQSLNKLVPNH